jgi:hypothetical protein
MRLLRYVAIPLAAIAISAGSLVAALSGQQPSQPASARLNRTIELLSQGKPTFGIFSHDRSLENARALARSGLDFVFIDMEHGPLDITPATARTLEAGRKAGGR